MSVFYMNYPFVNCHTHSKVDAQSISIRNIFLSENKVFTPDAFYSLGLHPWHIFTEHIDVESILLDFILKDKNLIAIGEIGIDRAIGTSVDLQKCLFIRQLKVAQKNNIPIIVHCVRAYSDILGVLKQENITIPVMLHGFCANNTITREFVRRNAYFSLGKQLYERNETLLKSLIDIPIEYLLLETDEQTVTIQQMYHIVSELKNVPVDELKQQLYRNFERCFMLLNHTAQNLQHQ